MSIWSPRRSSSLCLNLLGVFRQNGHSRWAHSPESWTKLWQDIYGPERVDVKASLYEIKRPDLVNVLDPGSKLLIWSVTLTVSLCLSGSESDPRPRLTTWSAVTKPCGLPLYLSTYALGTAGCETIMGCICTVYWKQSIRGIFPLFPKALSAFARRPGLPAGGCVSALISATDARSVLACLTCSTD